MVTHRRRFEGAQASVGGARRFVTALVGDRPDGPVAALLVSELAANAVVHARTPFEVSVSLGPAGVHVEVADGNPVEPAPRLLTEPWDEAGRGLFLVARLAFAWGSKPTADGKVVWFETDRRDGAPEP
jgi:anti-sigma regulatory factor (Ser/Thr protein kinase)